MQKLRYIHSRHQYRPIDEDNNASFSYAEQEGGAIWGVELLSIVLQIALIYMVAKALPVPLWVSISACVTCEFILRKLLAPASRVILGLMDRGKKKIIGKPIILTGSWWIDIFLAVLGLAAWGSVGFINQKSVFEQSIGLVEYTDIEILKLSQAKDKFNADSTAAVTLLNQAKSDIYNDFKDTEQGKVSSREQRINEAQSLLNTALLNSDLRLEVVARQKLQAAKSISIQKGELDYSSANNDFAQRLGMAKTFYIKQKEDVLKSVEGRLGSKSISYFAEIGLYIAFVLLVAVCIFVVERYKKMSNLSKFGIETIFSKREKEPQLIYEEISDRALKNRILAAHGLTESSLKALKRSESQMLDKAKDKLLQSGYELYFKGDTTYPRLKIIKKVA